MQHAYMQHGELACQPVMVCWPAARHCMSWNCPALQVFVEEQDSPGRYRLISEKSSRPQGRVHRLGCVGCWLGMGEGGRELLLLVCSQRLWLPVSWRAQWGVGTEVARGLSGRYNTDRVTAWARM